MDGLLRSVVLETVRLRLHPLDVGDAQEMVGVLGDPSIYEFTGGEPPTEPELEETYRFLAGQRSPDGSEGWLNWIVRERDTDRAVGVVQATVSDGGARAEVAWTVGPPWQRRGYAVEAASAMVQWLRGRAVRVVIAHVHPDHEASRRVAAAVGLRETEVVVDGERRWESGSLDA